MDSKSTAHEATGMGALHSTSRGSAFPVYVLAALCTISCAMAVTEHSKPFVVTRSKCIAPKERRIERLKAGYAVQEFRDDSQGRYWYVIVALEVTPTKKR